MRRGVSCPPFTLLWLWLWLPGLLVDGVLFQDVGNSSTPDLSSSSTACDPVEETLQGWAGYVYWTQQENLLCRESRKWTLSVPPFHGLFVSVQKMDLRPGTSVTLQRRTSDDQEIRVYDVHVWTDNDHTSRMMTFLGGMILNVEAPTRKKYPLSSFNITYTVYHETNLPQEQPEKFGGPIMFNCSQTHPVPEAMACDGVTHCIGKEDEVGCEYTLKGCGDWVPYHHHCLKLLGVRFFFYNVDISSAARHCEDDQAQLAVLPDEDGIRLVADLVYKTGLSSALVNLQKAKPVLKKYEHLYRYIWQWGPAGGPIAYEQTEIQRKGTMFDCAVMSIFPFVHFTPARCASINSNPVRVVCMRPNPNISYADPQHVAGVHLPEASGTVQQFLTKQCEDGSVVQIFHQCQWQGHVLSSSWSPNNFPLFHCVCGPPIHYTLLCDGHPDCEDESDEKGCPSSHTLSTKLSSNRFICANGQVMIDGRCDGVPHCLDNSDEDSCTTCAGAQIHCKGVGCVPQSYEHYFENCTRPLGLTATYTVWGYSPFALYVRLVSLDGYGMSSVVTRQYNAGYFSCNNGLHIPTFLLNNFESDCPEGEDENIPPGNFTCPGFYRCQNYGNCVHPDFVCDGVPHCPNKDDENYCTLTHPSNCTCEGFACSCHQLPSPLSDFWYLRYLDLNGVEQPSMGELPGLPFLQFLNASFCQLGNVTLMDMPQLKVLDLSYNALSGLSSMVMENLIGLTHLNVSGNALVTHLDASFSAFFTQAGLINIQHLVMANTHVSDIEDYSFISLSQLVSLDLRSDNLENYDKNIFGGLYALKVLHTDESRLCCSYFHTNIAECYAPVDELSSCNDLLRLDAFRVFLWSFAALTILGNCAVLIYRLVKREPKKTTSYVVLVSHLCIADLLMGVYMMIIGAADAYFRGDYVASETQWRQSKACIAAGFLAFVSSEVSAFIICLITLDRLLKLCFPFKPHLHLSAVSFMKLGCLAWGLGLLLAAVPFMGHLEFYGESSLCLPLPVTRHQFSGQTYAFLIFIVLNFLLFLFIGMGQIAIFWSVRKTKAAIKTQRQEEDSAIARRLFLVVFTDFCCWFPVGLMGLLAFSGLPIPGVVTVWVAVFVLPVNSALNPFLYTLNTIRERRKMKKMNQKSKRILRDLKNEIPKLAPDMMEEVVLAYVTSHRGIRMEKVCEVLHGHHQQEHTRAKEATIGAESEPGPSSGLESTNKPRQ